MICPFCKETILDEAIKCRYCGSMLTLGPANGMSADNITSDDMRAFVGPNTPYYLYQFSKFTITGKEKFCTTWNWSCFGFTFLWLLYRKMYVFSLITFVIFCIPGVNVLLHIGAGIVGNYLYYRHVKEKILEIRATQSPQNYFPVLEETGGVHNWAILVVIAVSILLAILFIIFFVTITSSISRFEIISI